jgi:hypothetical protein
MSPTRILNSSKFFQPTDEKPIHSVIAESKDAVVVVWYIKPGQEVSPHTHPDGQDTWTILARRKVLLGWNGFNEGDRHWRCSDCPSWLHT